MTANTTTAAVKVTAASAALKPQLDVQERVIKKGLRSYVEVGTALREIRDGGLYKAAGFKSFGAYCLDRWDMSRPNAYMHMEASEYAQNCLESGTDVPANAWQAIEQKKTAEYESREPEQQIEQEDKPEPEYDRAEFYRENFGNIFVQQEQAGEVTDALDLVKRLRAIPLTKYSPEAGRFMARRVDEAITELTAFHAQLVQAFPGPIVLVPDAIIGGSIVQTPLEEKEWATLELRQSLRREKATA